MNKLLFGAIAGIATGYCIRKMQEEHKFDPIIDRANEWAEKAKKKAKNVVDMAQNEAEYVKGRADSFMGKEKAKVTTAMNDKEGKM